MVTKDETEEEERVVVVIEGEDERWGGEWCRVRVRVNGKNDANNEYSNEMGNESLRGHVAKTTEKDN